MLLKKKSEDSSFHMQYVQSVVLATLTPETIESIANLVVAKLKQEKVEELKMTTKWRPEGWKAPEMIPWGDSRCSKILGIDDVALFERGADAMLEALRKEGLSHGLYRGLWRNIDDSGKWQVAESQGTYPLVVGVKGSLVFIPDEEAVNA